MKKPGSIRVRVILITVVAVTLLAAALMAVLFFVFASDTPLRDFIAIRGSLASGVFIILLVPALFSVVVSIFIFRFITEPLRKITESVESANRGVFRRELSKSLVQRQDEIGRLARSFVSMFRSIEGVIGDVESIADAVGSGRLAQRIEVSSMEGEYLKIASAVNRTLDIICSYLDLTHVALALYNEERKMIYSNVTMEEFFCMHDFEDHDEGFLRQIAGSGGFSSGLSLNPRVAAIFDPAMSNPVPFTTDIAILGHNGGSNFTMTIQRAGQHDARKGTACVILILSDVTMLTRAKIDAEMASNAKSEFLSRMSHEIRTPMNAVTGMTQIAKSSDDMEKIRGCLDQVENSSNHLLGVINDILDFSKMESGKLLLDISEFSLTENLDSIISMMLPRARERKITLRYSAENIQNDGVSTDSLRLNQVLINLLSNAIKFSHDGGEVSLSVRELGSRDGFSSYSFEVTDQGIGINEYHASRLFRPFEQADVSVTRNYGGTGLGLVISKTLVEMMGGKITLDSEEGAGSTFTFTIHCPSRPSAGEKVIPQIVSSQDEVYDFSGKRCLLVDDIEINREIIIELLADTNLAIETAENGLQAVEKFISSGNCYYDIILMDVQMPVMDGCRATMEIRHIERERVAIDPSCPKVPIVAMTANVMQEDVIKAMESGMNAHLGKPIELQVTLTTIKEQLSRPA